MENDHYAPPQAILEDVPASSTGELIPFEDRTTYPGMGSRIVETFRWIFKERERAGAAFRGTDAIGAPIGFICLVGYLPAVLPGLLAVFLPRTPFWMAWLHLPSAPPAQGFLLLFSALSVLVFTPVSLILAGFLGGLLNHVGLWLVRGTTHRHGLMSSIRSAFYTAAVISWVLFPLNLGKSIPGLAGQAFEALALPLVFLLPISYQGIMLARTHRVETWRGVLGACIPGLIFLGCLGTCFGLAFWFAGDAVREALRQARPGMF